MVAYGSEERPATSRSSKPTIPLLSYSDDFHMIHGMLGEMRALVSTVFVVPMLSVCLAREDRIAVKAALPLQTQEGALSSRKEVFR